MPRQEGLITLRTVTAPQPPPERRHGASSRRHAWALLLAVAAISAAAVASTARSSTATAAPASSPRTLTLYSIAEQEQFVNNKDDLTRGKGSNPFGNFKDNLPTTTKKAAGPFPGDEALFSFTLYADAGLRKKIGSARFTCQYDFSKDAFCDASFRLPRGDTLIASGTFNFNASSFDLAVLGGYGAYAGKTGVMEEVPGAGHSQKLTFRLS